MHPTLTHVPPSPHVVPIGDGCTKSARATFAPRFAPHLADEIPPDPPPITNRS